MLNLPTKCSRILRRRKRTTHTVQQHSIRAVASILVDRVLEVILSEAQVVSAVASEVPKALVEQISTSRIYSALSLEVKHEDGAEEAVQDSQRKSWLATISKCRPTSPSWMRQRACGKTFTSHR